MTDKEFNFIEDTRQKLLSLIKSPEESGVSIADVLTIVQTKQEELIKLLKDEIEATEPTSITERMNNIIDKFTGKKND